MSELGARKRSRVLSRASTQERDRGHEWVWIVPEDNGHLSPSTGEDDVQESGSFDEGLPFAAVVVIVPADDHDGVSLSSLGLVEVHDLNGRQATTLTLEHGAAPKLGDRAGEIPDLTGRVAGRLASKRLEGGRGAVPRCVALGYAQRGPGSGHDFCNVPERLGGSGGERSLHAVDTVLECAWERSAVGERDGEIRGSATGAGGQVGAERCTYLIPGGISVGVPGESDHRREGVSLRIREPD